LLNEKKPLGMDIVLALGACEKRTEKNDKDGLVVVVPLDDDKYFYDIIPKKTAEKATDACKVGAALAAAYIAMNQQDIEMDLYAPGDRACDEILSMAVHDNPMLIIDATAVIATKEAQRVSARLLIKLKVYDNYKDATADLEAAAERLHDSANKDVLSVKQWVVDHPAEAVLFPADPMIAPIYNNRIRIAKEMGRVPANVGRAVKCVFRIITSKC